MPLEGLKADVADWFIEGVVGFFLFMILGRNALGSWALIPVQVFIVIDSLWNILFFIVGLTVLGFVMEKVQKLEIAKGKKEGV